MIFDPTKHKIYIFQDFVDMRKGHSSLAMIVTQNMKFKMKDKSLFFFVSRNRKIMKGIFFDGTGLVLIHKKIEAGKFMSFNFSTGAFEIDENEFNIIFHGGQLPLSRKGKRINF